MQTYQCVRFLSANDANGLRLQSLDRDARSILDVIKRLEKQISIVASDNGSDLIVDLENQVANEIELKNVVYHLEKHGFYCCLVNEDSCVLYISWRNSKRRWCVRG